APTPPAFQAMVPPVGAPDASKTDASSRQCYSHLFMVTAIWHRPTVHSLSPAAKSLTLEAKAGRRQAWMGQLRPPLAHLFAGLVIGVDCDVEADDRDHPQELQHVTLH